MKVKSFFLFFLISIFFFVSVRPSYAALITVDNKGKIIWQVLGDSSLDIPKPSEIKVKNIADNIPATSDTMIALNNQDGKIVMNVTGDGQNKDVDVTNLNENLIEIQARGDTNDVKISQQNGKFVLSENGIDAQTSFPITIDPTKNQISVTTNSGDRLVSVLPYEATQLLTRARFIDKVDKPLSLNEDSNGQLMYKVDGTKQVNIFNVAKIDANVLSDVSASNGEILNLNQPQWLTLFGFLFK